VLVILNPIAGRRRRGLLRGTLAALGARGTILTVRETKGPGDAEAFAREAIAGGDLGAPYDVVAAAGGDGTLNEVINGLSAAAEPPPLASVPLGTINVLAREIGLSRRPAAVADTILGGSTLPVRLGIANGRRFLLTAGAGIDAAAVARLSPGLKRLIGRAAYFFAATQALIAKGDTTFEVEVEEARFRASSVIVVHASRYASHHIAAPGASLSDPHLHALVSLGHGRAALLRCALAWATGRIPDQPDIRILPARRIAIAAPAGRPVQLDGDNWLTTPVEIGLEERPISLLVPRSA